MPRIATTGRVERVPIGQNSLLCNASAPTYGSSSANIGISGSSALTIACWGYLTSVSGVQTLVTVGDAAGTNTGLTIRTSGASWNAFIQGTGALPASVPTIQNRWYEIVVTYSGGSSTVLIYVNGVLINGSGAVTMNLTNAPVRWGRDYSGTTPVTGGVSDVRVWNVALTANQILDMYNTKVVPTTGLVRRFKLNEGTGSSVSDSSTNADTGTITNPYWSRNNVPYGLPVTESASPAQLPGCLFFYEADQGVTLDGSNKVSQWNDQSGNAAHMTQGSGALRFQYTASSINGLPTVDMVSGTGNVMSATINFFATQPHTLVVLAKASNTQPLLFSGIVAIGSEVAGGNTSSIGTDNTRKLWFGGAGFGNPVFSVPVTGTNYLLMKTSDVYVTRSFINHVDQGSERQLGAFSISPLSTALLGQYTTGSDSGNWNVALVAGFAGELNTAQINALAKYCNDKYALGLSVGARVATTGRSLIT